MNVEFQKPEIKVTFDPAEVGISVGNPIARDYIEREAYTGEYTVTPATEEQTLETNGLRMTDDVTVEAIPEQYIIPSGSLTATANDTYNVTALAELVVAVPAPDLQTKSKTYTPSESQQTDTITADQGYDGLGEVDITVNSIPSEYIVPSGTKEITGNGTGIDVTEYAAVDVSVAPAIGSATTPATTITANPSISVNTGTGVITATASATKSVTPSVVEGYVSEGTAGTITVSGSNTTQLSTQSGKTITPTTSEQTAVDANKYTLGAVKVAAMPSGTEGTPTATKGNVNNHAISVTPSVTNSAGYIAGGTKSGTAVSVSASELVSGTKSITENGTGIDVTNYAAVDVSVSGGQPSLQTKSKSYTPSETAQSETITADQGYDGLDEVGITVGAISSTYVGSGINRRTSDNLSASGATVTAPAGYYENAATKTIGSASVRPPTELSGSGATLGTTASTLVMTKTMSNLVHVDTAGYISGDVWGNTDVTLQASVNIRSSSDLSQSGNTVTAPAGYYPNAATINVTGGSSKNIQYLMERYEVAATSYTATNLSIKVSKAGTYKCYWSMDRNTTSGTNGSQLYKNGSAVGSAHTTWTHNGASCEETLTLAANDTIVVRARSRSTSYYCGVSNLIIIEQ